MSFKVLIHGIWVGLTLTLSRSLTLLFCKSTLAPTFLRSTHIFLSTNQKTDECRGIEQALGSRFWHYFHYCCRYVRHCVRCCSANPWQVSVRDFVTKLISLTTGCYKHKIVLQSLIVLCYDCVVETCWVWLLYVHVFGVWLLRLTTSASDWPEPHNPRFWLAVNSNVWWLCPRSSCPSLPHFHLRGFDQWEARIRRLRPMRSVDNSLQYRHEKAMSGVCCADEAR